MQRVTALTLMQLDLDSVFDIKLVRLLPPFASRYLPFFIYIVFLFSHTLVYGFDGCCVIFTCLFDAYYPNFDLVRVDL